MKITKEQVLTKLNQDIVLVSSNNRESGNVYHWLQITYNPSTGIYKLYTSKDGVVIRSTQLNDWIIDSYNDCVQKIDDGVF